MASDDDDAAVRAGRAGGVERRKVLTVEVATLPDGRRVARYSHTPTPASAPAPAG